MQGSKAHILPAGVVDESLIAKFRSKEYQWDDCQAIILIHIDQQFGINSRFEKQPRTFKGTYLTVPMLYRDASSLLPMEDCIRNDHPILQIDNLLLRCLNIARHIEYTLAEKGYQSAVEEPRKIFLKLLAHAKKIPDARNIGRMIKKLEGRFNRECIELLGRYALCNERNQEQTLLQHRYLASLLSPAFGQLTQVYDSANQITLEEICYPITEKTEQQKTNIDRDDFRSLPEGVRMANVASAAKVKLNDRRLPAQCRESHQETVKNGWVVENLIHFPTGRSEKFSFLRSASLVPLVDLKQKNENTRSTQDNIAQLQLAAKRYGLSPKLHLTLLNTKVSKLGTLVTSVVTAKQKEQNTIVDVTCAAAKELNTNFTYYPVKTVSGMSPAEIDPVLVVDKDVGSNTLTDKGDRVKNIAIISKIASSKGMTPTFICPSGQDRSAVASELYTQMRIVDSYSANMVVVNRQHIEQCRNRAYPNAMLATLAAPGSFGLKSESIPGEFFLPETNALLFCDSTAHTNNKTPIAKKPLADLDNVVTAPKLSPVSRRITLSPPSRRPPSQGRTTLPAPIAPAAEVAVAEEDEQSQVHFTPPSVTDGALPPVETESFDDLWAIPTLYSPTSSRATLQKPRGPIVRVTTVRETKKDEPLIIPSNFKAAKAQIDSFIEKYRYSSQYVPFLESLTEDIREKDTQALQTLQDILNVIHDPKKQDDAIGRLFNTAKEMHQDRIRTKRRIAIGLMIFGIALMALGISMMAVPAANVFMQQQLLNAFILTAETYQLQLIEAATAAVGLALSLISVGLFYNTRNKGAPKALVDIAEAARENKL